MRPKLKNFFGPEPKCKALGSAKKCVFGKAPNFSKKAEIVFEKISGVRTYAVLLRELKATETGIKHARRGIDLSNDTRGLAMYMKKEKALLGKRHRLNAELKN